MYYYRDTKRDIPNTFGSDLIENKIYCIPEVIFLIDRGFIKRKDVPTDVLKRVDTEIEFILKTQVKKENGGTP
jgi:hypothetical protein